MIFEVAKVLKDKEIKKHLERLQKNNWIRPEQKEKIEKRMKNKDAILLIKKENDFYIEKYKLMNEYGVEIEFILNGIKNEDDYLEIVTLYEQGTVIKKISEQNLQKFFSFKEIRGEKSYNYVKEKEEYIFYAKVKEKEHRIYFEKIYGNWHRIRIGNFSLIEEEESLMLKEIINKI